MGEQCQIRLSKWYLERISTYKHVSKLYLNVYTWNCYCKIKKMTIFSAFEQNANLKQILYFLLSILWLKRSSSLFAAWRDCSRVSSNVVIFIIILPFYNCLISWVKGTVSQDFWMLVFSSKSSSWSPWEVPWDDFDFYPKFRRYLNLKSFPWC